MNMINYFQKLVGGTIFSLLIMFVFLAPVSQAQLFSGARDDACTAVDATDAGGKCDPAKLGASADKLSTVLNNIIDVLSIVIGIAAVIMLIVGGFRYVVSAGDSNGITSAKHTIIYAIVGLVIVSLAQVIVRFVLNKI